MGRSLGMSAQPPRHVFDTPLRFAVAHSSDQITLFTPNGQRLTLTPAAAAVSLGLLAQAVAASTSASPSNVHRFGQFASQRPLRRLVQRIRLAWRAAREAPEPSPRVLVAAFLTPMFLGVFATLGAVGLSGMASTAAALALLPWLGGLSLLLAPLAAFAAAPLLLDQEERRPVKFRQIRLCSAEP